MRTSTYKAPWRRKKKLRAFRPISPIESITFLLLLVIGSVASVRALQQKEVGSQSAKSGVQREPDLPPFDSADSVGVFIGVRTSNQDPKIVPVDFAVDDAVDLAHLFVFDLELVLADRVTLALAGEPQKPVSRYRLNQLRSHGARRAGASRCDLVSIVRNASKGSGPAGLLVIGISSHGFDFGGEHFVLTEDAWLDDLTDTAFPARKLFKAVGETASQRRLVLIDACRESLSLTRTVPTSDIKISGKALPTPALQSAISQSQGQAILSAARFGGFAYGDGQFFNGVFTKAVIDALSCHAGTGPSGFVTVETLADSVDQAVVRWTRDHFHQNPSSNLGIDRKLAGPVNQLPLAQCGGKSN